jgi:polyhydroxyalkanoate synthesis repressor PhaR
MSEKITIKKYANRRLYDTRQSRYVTLHEVAQGIRDGQQVEVLDAKTKEDVTTFILTQILLEEAKHKQLLLPADLLHTIIRYGDNVLLEFFENHLEQAIQSYLSYKTSFDTQFKKWLEIGMDMSEVAQKSFENVNPLESIFKGFSSPSANQKKKD